MQITSNIFDDKYLGGDELIISHQRASARSAKPKRCDASDFSKGKV